MTIPLPVLPGSEALGAAFLIGLLALAALTRWMSSFRA